MLQRLEPRTLDDAAIALAEAARLFAGAFSGFTRVLLAVSGGADSTAMLLLAAEAGGLELAVATVDHALRPDAGAEVAAVAALCGALGLPHAHLSAPLGDRASRIEQTARELRYAALADHARAIGADAVATAHTLDDQAETVLMRLAAGSGPAGLAGMRDSVLRDGVRHVRPLLGVTKARLVATLRARGVAWAEDGMNRDPRFARARLRASRAALEREGLTAARLATLATRMARADAALASAADKAARDHLVRDGAGWTIAADAAGLADELRLRLLARAIADAGDGPVRLERLERLAARVWGEPSGAATLAGARISWKGGVVAVRRAPPRGARTA